MGRLSSKTHKLHLDTRHVTQAQLEYRTDLLFIPLQYYGKRDMVK